MATRRHHALFIPSPSQQPATARAAGVAEGLPVVTRFAYHYWQRHSRLVELDELLEVGTRALKRVIGDYDPQRGAFRDFLEARLHWSMLACLHARASERRREPVESDEERPPPPTVDFRDGLVKGWLFPQIDRAAAASQLDGSRPAAPLSPADLTVYDELARSATTHPPRKSSGAEVGDEHAEE